MRASSKDIIRLYFQRGKAAGMLCYETKGRAKIAGFMFEKIAPAASASAAIAWQDSTEFPRPA